MVEGNITMNSDDNHFVTGPRQDNGPNGEAYNQYDTYTGTWTNSILNHLG